MPENYCELLFLFGEFLTIHCFSFILNNNIRIIKLFFFVNVNLCHIELN